MKIFPQYLLYSLLLATYASAPQAQQSTAGAPAPRAYIDATATHMLSVPRWHAVDAVFIDVDKDGDLDLVGLVGDLDEKLNTVNLQLGRRRIAASMIGGLAETQEMLDFCGQHGIVSDVEMIDMQSINEAFVRMEKGEVKYRFVIDMASLPGA